MRFEAFDSSWFNSEAYAQLWRSEREEAETSLRYSSYEVLEAIQM